MAVWDLRNPKGSPVVVQKGEGNPLRTLSIAELAATMGPVGNGRQGPAEALRGRIANLIGGTYSAVTFSPDGRQLAAGRADGSIHVWPLWSKLADDFCARVVRNLSMEEWQTYVGADFPYERTCPALPPGVGAPGSKP